jgi:hypothetical protein
MMVSDSINEVQVKLRCFKNISQAWSFVNFFFSKKKKKKSRHTKQHAMQNLDTTKQNEMHARKIKMHDLRCMNMHEPKP